MDSDQCHISHSIIKAVIVHFQVSALFGMVQLSPWTLPSMVPQARSQGGFGRTALLEKRSTIFGIQVQIFRSKSPLATVY